MKNMRWLWWTAAVFLLALTSIATAQETPTATTPAPVELTPTPDRLAPPPTVASPTQADEGAYLFWLNCQPCHGDKGQGLTDEWRAQYPPEDQYCWGRGCHGERPYEGGFTLPKTVPAVVGEDSLENFETVGQLYNYIRVAMPFEAKGALPEEEYLAITAFLAREHGVWDGTPLNSENVHNFRLKPLTKENVEESVQEVVTEAPQEDNVETVPLRFATSSIVLFGIVVIILALVAGAIWLWRQWVQ